MLVGVRALVVLLAVTSCACQAAGDDSSSGDQPTANTGSLENAELSTPTTATESPLTELTRLPEQELCSLVSATRVEALTGRTPSLPPDYTTLGSFGSNCIYYDSVSFEIAVRLEIGVLSYVELEQIWVFDDEITTTRAIPYTRCRIAAKPAICAEPYETGDLPFGATVLVQLGAPTDPALLVEAPTTDAAIAVAEEAHANLELP